MVRSRPTSSGTRGSQLSRSRARLMSGQRCTGSSTGSGWGTVGRRGAIGGVVFYEGGAEADEGDDLLGERADCRLDRVAEVDRAGDIVGCRHQPHEALDEVID